MFTSPYNLAQTSELGGVTTRAPPDASNSRYLHRPLSPEGLRHIDGFCRSYGLLAQTSELGGVTTYQSGSVVFGPQLAQTSELGGVTTSMS